METGENQNLELDQPVDPFYQLSVYRDTFLEAAAAWANRPVKSALKPFMEATSNLGQAFCDVADEIYTDEYFERREKAEQLTSLFVEDDTRRVLCFRTLAPAGFFEAVDSDLTYKDFEAILDEPDLQSFNSLTAELYLEALKTDFETLFECIPLESEGLESATPARNIYKQLGRVGALAGGIALGLFAGQQLQKRLDR